MCSVRLRAGVETGAAATAFLKRRQQQRSANGCKFSAGQWGRVNVCPGWLGFDLTRSLDAGAALGRRHNIDVKMARPRRGEETVRGSQR